MKKNELAQEYETYESLMKTFDEAEAAGDESGMEAAKAGYQKLLESIRAKGEAYNHISRLYNDARKRGNDYIDLSEPYQYEKAKDLVETLRDFGFDHVTFSSCWSSAVETAWEFCKLGCAVEGMTEINGTTKAFMSDEYERVPAYLFRI